MSAFLHSEYNLLPFLCYIFEAVTLLNSVLPSPNYDHISIKKKKKNYLRALNAMQNPFGGSD